MSDPAGPLKHIPDLQDPKMKENLEVMTQFLAAPPPRKIPPRLNRSCFPPILLIGIILLVLGGVGTGVLGTLYFTLSAPMKNNVFSGAVIPLMLPAGVILAVWGGMIRRAKLLALQSGQLYEAIITDISRVSLRKNREHYRRVSFSFSDSLGNPVQAFELVPEHDIAIFETLAKEGDKENLDVLYTPGASNQVYVPLKFILSWK